MIDRRIIGTPTMESTTVLERGPVSKFALAVGDDSDIYQSLPAARTAGFENIPAPPTYGFAMSYWGAFDELQPERGDELSNVNEAIGKLMSGGGLILHGEQEFRYHKPLLVGQTLRSSGRIADVYEKISGSGSRMIFLTTETDYFDENGELVLTQIFTLINKL